MLVKAYCGLMLIEIDGLFICIDQYTDKIKASGTKEECETFFNNYVKEMCL